MEQFRVEYLTIFANENTFCSNSDSLKHLFQSDSCISVSQNYIQVDNIDFSFDIQSGTTTNTEHKYFHVTIQCKEKENLPIFEKLLKSVRGILHRLADKDPQVLWNDIGLFYADDAYPKIHKLENLMRKLITKFMLTSIGLGWIKETIPNEVKQSIKNRTSKEENNYLHQVDFIQLSNFLFKPYTIGETQEIIRLINGSRYNTDLVLEDLKKLVPKSNWERYFSSIVDCESDYLRVRWEKLYELRNHVAHNRSLSKSQHSKITTLIEEIKPKIIDAISKLEDIKVTDIERENVAESVAIDFHKLNGELIKHWKGLHDRLLALAQIVVKKDNKEKLERQKNNVPSILNILKSEGAISSEMRKQINLSYRLRNVIVHHADVIFPDDKLLSEIEIINSLISKLDELIATVNEGGEICIDEVLVYDDELIEDLTKDGDKELE